MTDPRTAEDKVDPPITRKQSEEKCDHAWVLNVKPAVCLWCGARKQPKGKRS